MRRSVLLVSALALLACCATCLGTKTNVAARYTESQAASIRTSSHVAAVDMSASQVTAFLNAANDMTGMVNVWNENDLLAACSTANSPTGVIACDSQGNPTILSFPALGSGSNKLSPWLGNLTELNTLSINLVSSYTGTYPPAWSTLTKLTSLTVTGGRLSGGVPSEWSTMTKLTNLDLSFRIRLSGASETIGPAPAWVSNVATIALDGANFGSDTNIPASWFSSSKTTSLRLFNLVWSGNIDSSLISNKMLRTFLLEARRFNGTTPGTGKSLSALNDLSGMTSLTSFSLIGSAHSGNIPSKWPATLDSVSISGAANIDGTIPASIVSGSMLTSFTLSDLPQVTGAIPLPSAPLQSKLLSYVLLDMRGLTGSIPTGLFSIPSLAEINFQYLSSAQPTAIAALSASGKCNLQKLTITHSQLSGSIPAELPSSCKNLTEVDLSSNYLTDALPSDWSALTPGLLSFRASSNRLTGSVPVFKWGDVQRTAYDGLSLELQDNQLTGTIPAALISNKILNFYIQGNALDICSNNATLAPILEQAAVGDWSCAVVPQASASACGCSNTWTNCLDFDGCSTPVAPMTTAPLEALPPFVTSGPLAPAFTAPPSDTPSSAGSKTTLVIASVAATLLAVLAL